MIRFKLAGLTVITRASPSVPIEHMSRAPTAPPSGFVGYLREKLHVILLHSNSTNSTVDVRRITNFALNISAQKNEKGNVRTEHRMWTFVFPFADHRGSNLPQMFVEAQTWRMGEFSWAAFATLSFSLLAALTASLLPGSNCGRGGRRTRP